MTEPELDRGFNRGAWKTLLIAGLWLAFGGAWAQPATLHPFANGSYQQLLKAHQGKPFVLVLWSLTCPACLKEMPLIKRLQQEWPAIDLVMLATDAPAEKPQVQQVLAKFGLETLENWQYATDDPVKLNDEIDPDWYGELPRTYFFDAGHRRSGVSGVLTPAVYAKRLAALKQGSPAR